MRAATVTEGWSGAARGQEVTVHLQLGSSLQRLSMWSNGQLETHKPFQTKGPDPADGGAWQLSLARDGDGKEGSTSCEVPGAVLRGLDCLLSQMF